VKPCAVGDSADARANTDNEEMLADPAVRAAGLAQRIRVRFGIAVHPRTIEG